MACTCIFRGSKPLRRTIISPFTSVLIVSPLIYIISFIYCRAAPIAIDRAVKEILSNNAPRSVNISSQTTRELVLKVVTDVKFFCLWLFLMSHNLISVFFPSFFLCFTVIKLYGRTMPWSRMRHSYIMQPM